MRRTLLFALLGLALLQTQGCFRGLGEAFAKAVAEAMVQSAMSLSPITVRLFPCEAAEADPGMNVPLVPSVVSITREPFTPPEAAACDASPSWVTLVEFSQSFRGSQTGPGFKLQVPLPGTLAKSGGRLAISECGVRFLTPAWGPGWQRRIIVTSPTPDRFWEAAFTRTDGWTGADGTATVRLPGDRALWLFGDSFIGPVRNGKHAEGTAMVNNTIAVSPTGAGFPPSPQSVQFAWSTAVDNKPAAWSIPDGTPQGEKAEWFWPSGGGIVAPNAYGRLLLFMTKLGRRADAPKDSIWNFEARGTTLITIDNPQDDLSSWRQTQHTIAPLLDAANRQVTWGAAVLPRDESRDNLYIVGIDATDVLDKKMLLARAPARTIETFDTWRFWDGKRWSRNPAEAAPIASPLASELSMHRLRVGDRDRYIMLYSELTLGPKILCRIADNPEGPWSDPQTLYTCPEPAQDKKLMVYACKAHPELSRPGELLVSYCVNSTDFWDVIAHAKKYRPRFIRIPLTSIEAIEPKAFPR